MAIAGKVGAVYIQTADAAVVFTDEATTANATYDRYTITDSTKRYWDKNTEVVVKVDGVTQSSGYTIEHPGGAVVFDTPLTGTEVVTVSGAYLTVSQAGGFFNWSLELETDMQDVTTFASSGWKENKPTVNGFTGSAEAYWGDGTFLSKLGTEVIVVFYVDSTANAYRYEGFGIIQGESIEDPVDGIINDSIEIQGTGKLYYRED